MYKLIIIFQVDGEKHKGYGRTKQLAKQAAAEVAFANLVKPLTSSDNNKDIPWATIASFALYKLLMEWQEGKVGMNEPSQQCITTLPAGLTLFHKLNLNFLTLFFLIYKKIRNFKRTYLFFYNSLYDLVACNHQKERVIFDYFKNVFYYNFF